MTNSNNNMPRPWADPYYEARKAYNEAMAELFQAQSTPSPEAAQQPQEALTPAPVKTVGDASNLHNVA